MPLIRAFEKLLYRGFYRTLVPLLPAEIRLLMDLFQFSMYQLAFSAELAAEEHFTTHDFLAAWLHHHFYLAADLDLRPELRLVEDLDLDALSCLEMVGDVETYYNVLIPASEIPKLTTIADLERCVGQQLACAA